MRLRKIALISAIAMVVVGLVFMVYGLANLNSESKSNQPETNGASTAVDTTAVAVTTSTATEPTTKPPTEPTTKVKKKSKIKTAETTSTIENTPLWKRFTPICQYPELPTGCEITSLTMALRYYGFNFKKENLSDKYLDKGKVGTVDPRVAFEGDPRDGDSYGCYAPVIVNTANKYLKAKGSNLRAYEVEGEDFNSLFRFTDKDIPVIIWCTYKLQPGHFSVTWNVDGKDITWYTPEHCMVLLGEKNGKAVVADPIYGKIKAYDKALLEKRYTELFKQAIVIK